MVKIVCLSYYVQAIREREKIVRQKLRNFLFFFHTHKILGKRACHKCIRLASYQYKDNGTIAEDRLFLLLWL